MSPILKKPDLSDSSLNSHQAFYKLPGRLEQTKTLDDWLMLLTTLVFELWPMGQ